jgi:hypothetical protein
MRVRPTLLCDLAAPLLVGWISACLAQPAPPECALTDHACVDESYSRMCARSSDISDSAVRRLRSGVPTMPAPISSPTYLGSQLGAAP